MRSGFVNLPTCYHLFVTSKLIPVSLSQSFVDECRVAKMLTYVFVSVILLFKMAPKPSAEVLSRVVSIEGCDEPYGENALVR